MLQQTRVETVLGYYDRFLARFPDLAALAAAPLEAVLQSWAGLGYYARARQAHRCARLLVQTRGGVFPEDAAGLEALPGIGPSTAAAIAAFCHGERAAILDGNVKRVLARHAAIEGDPRQRATHEQLRRVATELLPPARDMATYTQAIMDLGATICTRTRPRCERCPVAATCRARSEGRTDELPARRPARARPERQAHLLLVVHRRAVLLEERPPRGLWGGLLSAPQFDERRALRRAARRYGSAPPVALAQRRHAFTHYTLCYTPHVLALQGPRPPAAPGQRWLALRAATDAALPAPILTLLGELRDGAATAPAPARRR